MLQYFFINSYKGVCIIVKIDTLKHIKPKNRVAVFKTRYFINIDFIFINKK